MKSVYIDCHDCKPRKGFMSSLLRILGARSLQCTVTCGRCAHTFTRRVPDVKSQGVVCPECGIVNAVAAGR